MTPTEGLIGEGGLIASLRELSRGRRTGILTVQGTNEIIALSFLDGEIVGADALNQSLEDGLGEVLTGQNLIDPADFAGLAAEHEAGGGRVLDLLVERSYLSRGQLLDSLRSHIYLLCRTVLSWRSGEYRFYQGNEVAYEAGLRPVGVGELLVRASLEMGAAGPLMETVPRMHEIYRRTPAALEGVIEGQPAKSLEQVEDRELFQMIDGQRTLGEIAEEEERSAYELQDAVYTWREAGLIEAIGEGEPIAEVEEPFPEPPVAAEMVLSGTDSGLATAAPPPEDVPESKPRRVRKKRGIGRFKRQESAIILWSARFVAVAAFVVAVGLLVWAPDRYLLPLPWHGALRHQLDHQQRAALELKIDGAARTFFMLYGRYPETLDELIANRALAPADTLNPAGERIVLSSGPSNYVVQHAAGGEDTDLWAGSIAGNFLLDPDFSAATPPPDEPPLVLLD